MTQVDINKKLVYAFVFATTLLTSQFIVYYGMNSHPTCNYKPYPDLILKTCKFVGIG